MEELKNKILQAMQSDFIGDVQFDEDEITQMKEDCKKLHDNTERLLFLILLAQFGLNTSNEDRFKRITC